MSDDCYGIMVYAAAGGPSPTRATLELLGLGRTLAAKLASVRGHTPWVAAALCGHGVEEAARSLAGFADRVHCYDDPALAVYHPGRWARALARLAARYRPEIMIFPTGCVGQETAASLAARLRTGLASHAVGLDIDDQGRLIQLVASFGAGVLGEILCPEHRPQMVTVTPGLFSPAGPLPVPGRMIREEFPPGDDLGLSVTGVEEKTVSPARLEDAPLVLAGGFGLRDRANWQALEELGGLLQAPVGCTRPVLDEGWLDDERRMIGISGTVVAPAVYLGLGISGSAHHTVGMDRSGYVIAVNGDSQAPLFRLADLAVVGDAGDIVREMLKILDGKKSPD